MAKKQRVQKAKELTNNQASSLAYQGKVQFQILHGNKVISTKNYSNNGLPDLFKYISYALAGTYHSTLRPCKIALFHYDPQNGQYKKPADFNWTEALANNVLSEASPYIVYDAAPVIKATAAGYATVFRFKIPFNWLYSKNFNVIGLFTENNSNCAYYLCTADGEDGKKEWAYPLADIKDIVGNYSLIIEWTMEVSNK
jgi:hypothetical protein